MNDEKRLASRKLWVFVGTGGVFLINGIAGNLLDEGTLEYVLKLAAVYLVGQAGVDIVKQVKAMRKGNQ